MASFNASFVASEYALTNPPVPRSIPPKYLVTTINIFDSSFPLITFKIGAPAVLLGSPSSLDFVIISSFKVIEYANVLCLAS